MQGESCEVSVSKIVIGALTAAAWFALCYVARAEGHCGPIRDYGSCIGNYVGHPVSESGIDIAR
jgi:hypothetical protein